MQKRRPWRTTAVGINIALATMIQPAARAVAAETVVPAPLPAPLFPALSYADMADLTLRAPVAAAVSVLEATRLKGEYAPNLSAGNARFLIDATVLSLFKGRDGLAGNIQYIVDIPLDARAKPPVLKKRRFIILGDRVPNRPQQIRLLAPRAQIDWSPAAESRLRAILTEANAAEAPPRITGVGRAFHVPGAIPGESETQIFLTTDDGRPVSLNVLRRPGEKPRWAVALAEIVDDSAAPPARDTLLWYRLACWLPRALPTSAKAGLEPDDAVTATQDYAIIIAGLGPCERTLVK